ncbi:hypothetical protein [Hymenobacter norwichensis]|uniref:hypothetical protein n=1 Tax=Hymenobacter norwichensis TaxID=223903 RepID=UPI0003B398A9|nr:hypothetical protein [Hymenobacter norwichensis]
MPDLFLSLLYRLGQLAYWYCVDFMVNLADLTGTSYPEANTWVLLLCIPGLLSLLLLVRLWQRHHLRYLRRRVAAKMTTE